MRDRMLIHALKHSRETHIYLILQKIMNDEGTYIFSLYLLTLSLQLKTISEKKLQTSSKFLF